MRLSGAVISEEMHLDEKVSVGFFFGGGGFRRTGILSRGSLVSQTETDQRTSETHDRQPENTDFLLFFFFIFSFAPWMTRKNMLKVLSDRGNIISWIRQAHWS